MDKFAEEMYVGERKRDASSKVRGFIYQDLLAIEQLIDSDDETFELYSEWAEDIYYESDEEVVITQVKYYSKSQINFQEIYTELFYQYIRLYLLGCNKNITCRLSYYAGGTKIRIGDSNHIKKNINKISECNLSELDVQQKLEILRKVYVKEDGTERKKKEREEFIYKIASNSQLLDKFIKNSYHEDLRTQNLEDFREILENKIYELIKNNKKAIKIDEWEEEILSQVCLAVAVIYVQESYDEASNSGSLRRRTKTELMNRFFNIVNGVNGSQTIISVLDYYVDECLMDYILEDSSLEDIVCNEIKEVRDFYENLASSTKKFFSTYLSADEGQISLINTISKKKYRRFSKEDYINKSYMEKIYVFMEHKDLFSSYLRDVWKVLYNLNCIQFDKYINVDFKEYIKFNFPEYKNTVILPALGVYNPKIEAKDVFSRYKLMNEKPNKWLWRNNRIRGLRNYNLDVKQITEELKDNPAYIVDDTFEVECMKCIKIEDNLSNKEKCNECIFSKECLHERNGYKDELE